MRPRMILRGLLIATFLVVPGASVRAADDAEAFETWVRPLLVENCRKCHGPEKQKGGLRVDSRKSLIEGGENGPAIEPGRPERSLLIQAVRRRGELKMPPNRKLRDDQIAALERWIASGAHWPAGDKVADRPDEAQRRHWAFQTVRDPAPPSVRREAWCRNPIDAFILARLEAAGLEPSPPADRRTLLRRLTYDLTGLPPTPEDVAAFLDDPDPDAYVKRVDRLLASPHFGEHWGRHWLDVARYSDTKGYVYAREERFFVHAPAYRDWVVKAMNDDLPYNLFLLQQIAADRAVTDDPRALAALGFLTIGRRFLGVTHDIIDDRIDVVTRGTMGLTVACARCHDHKFDPIPTRDYYSLHGVFLNGTERLVPLVPPESRSKAFRDEFEKRQKALREGMAASRAEASGRVRARLADYLMAQRQLASFPQEGFDIVIGKDDLNPAFVRRWAAYLEASARSDDPIFRPWRRFASLGDEEFSARAPAVTSELRESGPPALNPAVARAFATAPASLQEVAARYSRLFTEADRDRETDENRPLRQVIHGPGSPCEIPDEPIVTTEWYFDSDTVNHLWKLQGDFDRWLIQAPDAPPFALAVLDRAEIREPRVLRRGNPANPGDPVSRHFLSAIAGPNPRPFAIGSGRLELAQAIIDPANPLTARVWINRVWMHHFGAGLVRTPSDFGLRAEPPSHPKLLDWLASRLVDEGWSTKAIHRMILLSSVYQQSSTPPDDPPRRERVQRIDPGNRLLWRMNPHRLTFEETRDSMLSASGELETRIGGRASDLFPGGAANLRRTLYGLVDRQFLPTVLRVFDFANPDLHIPARVETTDPQQALFALNHPFVAARARRLAARVARLEPDEAVRRLYLVAYQREPTDSQRRAAVAFLASAEAEPRPSPSPESLAWSYGFGAIDPETGRLSGFHRLPHFDGSAWGGGPQWPDPVLGWVRLTADGGHPGNDPNHAAVRRWTAPRKSTVTIRSTAIHDVAAGDGIRCWILSSRQGVLKSLVLHNARANLDLDRLDVEPGETIDFVVDIRNNLNSDQFLWAPTIRGSRPETSWEARRDFVGPPTPTLSPIEQLAQVLLMTNEFLFVD